MRQDRHQPPEIPVGVLVAVDEDQAFADGAEVRVCDG
jgi:hypothetical protein